MDIIDPTQELNEQQKDLRRKVSAAIEKHPDLYVVLESPVSGYVGAAEITDNGIVLTDALSAIVARVPASTMVGGRGQMQLVGQLQLEPPLGAHQGGISTLRLPGQRAYYHVSNMHPSDLVQLIKSYDDLIDGARANSATVWGPADLEWDGEE